MLSKPLAYASALDRGGCRLRNRRHTSFVEAFWSPALTPLQKCAGKSRCYCDSINYRSEAGEDLSLSGGASSVFLVFFS